MSKKKHPKYRHDPKNPNRQGKIKEKRKRNEKQSNKKHPIRHKNHETSKQAGKKIRKNTKKKKKRKNTQTGRKTNPTNIQTGRKTSDSECRAPARSLVCPMISQTSFSHSFRQTPKPYSFASVATMDEHQPGVQLLTIAGRRPTKACTSALALGQSRRVIIIRPSELFEGKGHTEHDSSEQRHKGHVPQEHRAEPDNAAPIEDPVFF